MNVDKITRMEPNGPDEAGLETWPEMDAADLDSPVPVQHGHLYYHDEAVGLEIGVWDCTPFTSKMGPYSVDEFMYLLEGSVTIEQEDGTSTTVSAGQSFYIPKGLVCRWVQTEYVRKYFVILGLPNGKAHDDPASFGVICPKAGDKVEPIEIKDTSLILGAVPEQHIRSYYEDTSGQLSLGQWHSTPFERPVFEFNRFELMVILEGEARISDGAGNEQKFKAGEVAFVPKGAAYKWQNDEFVSKIYCTFEPN
ncbi:cupin domain-containing protein [Rhodovibrionaceae bacterium A322]